ncbi:hypothetical protein [Kribbella qitaiheensis]|uniref:hypothetical protein n=1 Tax=Kribbella qitaiheensis TaxID=1544730 RepID=UPI001FE95912|nr:hypothetical protein [Kribbella qitaiheensis]
MRDNGLTASAYASMGGIDPLVAEPVLAALAEAGIAAYAVTPGEPGPSGESGAAASEPVKESDGDSASAELAEVDVPKKADVDAPEKSEPAEKLAAGLDEIFVDADSTEQARGVIDRSAEDAEWKSLVEQFNAPSAPGHSDTPVPRWPASEDVDESSYEPLIDVPAGLIVGDTDEDPPDEPPARRTDDPHDHFVPPEPPRGPRLDWISRGRLARAAGRADAADPGRSARLRHRPDHDTRGRRLHRRIPHPGDPDERPVAPGGHPGRRGCRLSALECRSSDNPTTTAEEAAPCRSPRPSRSPAT